MVQSEGILASFNYSSNITACVTCYGNMGQKPIHVITIARALSGSSQIIQKYNYQVENIGNCGTTAHVHTQGTQLFVSNIKLL